MFFKYIDEVYTDFIRTKSVDELLSLVDKIYEMIERKGYIIIGRIEVVKRSK